jgi:hypothetical protein
MSERIETQVSQMVDVIDQEYPEITVAELEAVRGPELVAVQPGGRTHRPLLVAAAIVIVLAIVGGIWLVLRDTGDDPADQPTITEPEPTVVAPEPAQEEGLEVDPVDIDWTVVEQPPDFDVTSLVSTFASALGPFVAAGPDDPSGQLSVIWTSTDGISWEAQPAPPGAHGWLIAGHGSVVLLPRVIDGDSGCEQPEGSSLYPGTCTAYLSEEGQVWEEAPTPWDTSYEAMDHRFLLRNVSTTLRINPRSPGLLYAPNSLVMEFDDGFVQVTNGETPPYPFEAFQSTDGEEWSATISDIAAINEGVGPDIFESACRATVWGSSVVWIQPDPTGPQLWQTFNGIDWSSIPIEIDRIADHCLYTTGAGLVFAPRGVDGDAAFISPNGREWRKIDLPIRGEVHVTYDAIFVLGANNQELAVGHLENREP